MDRSIARAVQGHAGHTAPQADEREAPQAAKAAAGPNAGHAGARPGSISAPTAQAIEPPEATPLAARVCALEQRYREIAATRMAGVALCHPGLEVAAIDFAPDADGAGAIGALVTPWFMNLVWLPLPLPLPMAGARPHDPAAPPPAALRVGETRRRAVGPEIFEFLGAHEAGLGDFEACSLFSPMFEFADQAAAVETARQVLRLLREPPPQAPARADAADGTPGVALAAPALAPASPDPASHPSSVPLPLPSKPAAPPRRAFLFGRRA